MGQQINIPQIVDIINEFGGKKTLDHPLKSFMILKNNIVVHIIEEALQEETHMKRAKRRGTLIGRERIKVSTRRGSARRNTF